jgi:hypothetical protein
VACLAALTLAFAAAAPEHAQAAPCSPDQVDYEFNTLVIQGDSSPGNFCDEYLGVKCNSLGYIAFLYGEPATDPPSETQIAGPVPCGSLERLDVYGSNDNDFIDLRGVTAANGFSGVKVYADGGLGVDKVFGSGFADRLVQGDDASALGELRGEGGNDILLGDDRGDTLKGGPGNDRLDGRSGPDLMKGGPGNDRLFGRDGRDSLTGGPGTDLLKGGPGQDFLFGGPGDTLVQ